MFTITKMFVQMFLHARYAMRMFTRVNIFCNYCIYILIYILMYLHRYYLLAAQCDPSTSTPAFCWGGGGGCNLLPNFEEGGSLTEFQLLEESYLERGLAKNMVVVFLNQSQSIPLKLSNYFGQVDVWRVIVYVFLPTHVA